MGRRKFMICDKATARELFNALSSEQQFIIEDRAGVKAENMLFNANQYHDFNDNLKSTQKKIIAYYCKFNN